MKKNTFITLMTILFIGITHGFSQKVAVIGINHNSSSPNTDGFSFVALEDLPSGEVIYFTSNEYDATTNVFTYNGAPTGEGVVVFTSTSIISKGTVIFVDETGTTTDVFTVSCSVGGACGTAIFPAAATENFSLATNGDSIYAYADTNSNPTDAIGEIYAVLYTGTGEAPGQNGGTIPANENPTQGGDHPNAIVIDGFPDDGNINIGPDRVEYKFNPASLRDAVSKTSLENPINYLWQVSNQDLSIVPFTNLNLSGANPIATISVSPTSLNENSGSSYTYTFSLDTNAAANTTINFSVSGTAILNTDYTQSGATTFNASTGTVVIASGTNSKTISITPTGDTALEANENISITLTAGSGYDAGSPSIATATIVNDDSIAITPVIAITGVNTDTTEGFSFVALDDITAGEVYYFTDNEYNNSTLTFSSGEFVASWTAPSGGVLRGEVIVVKETSTNSFTTYCSSGNCGSVTLHSGSFSLATGGETLSAYKDTDNDPTNEITNIQAVLFTGNTSSSGGNIPSIEDPTSIYVGSILVDGFTSIAPNRTEYDPSKRNITVDQANFQNTSNWLHAQTNQDLSTVPFNNIIISTGSANPILTLTISPTSVIEDSGTGIVYTFSLSTNATSDIVINFDVSGTATFTSDYTVTGATTFNTTNGTATIANGTNSVTVTITPVADTDVETQETVKLTIASEIGYDGGSPNEAIGYINNDDTSNSDPLVAITGINHTDPDGFSFVAAKDIPANTTIYFTENSFNKNTLLFDSGDAVLSYTSPSTVIPKGDVIVIKETSPDTFSINCNGDSGAACGSISLISGNFSPATSGETFYAYEDNDNDPTNGVIDIYAVIYTGNGSSGSSGGSIPSLEDPSEIFLSALVIDGFPATQPNRTEYDSTKRNILVDQANFENIANWIYAQTNQDLSTVPFTILNIVDTTPPTAICKAFTTQLGASGTVTISASDVNDGSSDNVGIASMSISPNTFNCSDVSATPINVTLTITDAAGNSDTCIAQVTIEPSALPIPEFTSNSTTSCINTAFNFTDLSCQADSWLWDFGDGTTSIEQNPTHTYSEVGSFTVSLTITDSSNNTNNIVKTNYITINPPKAQFTLNPGTGGSTPHTVFFTDQSTLPDTWSWDFGDGNTSTAQNPIHTYTAFGDFTTKLTVTDTIFGCSDFTEKLVKIAKPNSNFTSNTQFGCGPLTVNFEDTSTVSGNDTIESWLWDFGDGTTSTEQNPTHIYENSGSYSVSLKTTLTTTGITDTNSKSNYIQVVGPNVNFTTTNTTVGCPDLTINFEDQTVFSSPPTSWTWDFGDGTTSALQNPTHTYTTYGSYDVSLTVNDLDGCSKTIIKENYIITTDNIPPVATSKTPFILNLNENGTISINPLDINNGSSDNCSIASISIDKSVFDCTNLGDNIVTLTVKDAAGNTSYASTTVTVVDTTAPTVITQDITVELDVNGAVSFSAQQIDNGSFDNCTIESIALDTTTFNCTNTGENTVTLTVTDVNGNSANATAIVTVEDNIAPNVAVQNTTVKLDANGTANITVEDIDNGSSDNCEIETLVLDTTSFGCTAIGENTVTLTVTDVNGNSVNAAAVVTVEDNIAPNVIVNDITVKLDETGTASITVEDINNGSLDNCEIETLVLDITTFDCTNVGENTVTLTVTDVNGNSANAAAVVTVEDNIAPNVIVNDITVELDADGTASITVEDINNGSSDNCEIETFVLDTTSFDCTNVGENTVTLTLTDMNGNSANAAAVVTVEDNILPTVIVNDITVKLDETGTASINVEDINNGSSDNCEIESISIDVTSFDCTSIGENTVTLTVIDVSGNSANTAAIVTVEDSIAPTANCAAPFTIQLDETGTANITVEDINNGSSDNCDIESMSIDVTSFDCTSIGDNTVTLTLTDTNGNTSMCTTIVTVEDTTAPIVITRNISVELDSNGNAAITAEDIDDGSFDACGIASLSIDQTTFSCPTLGDTTVTLTVIDNAGNSASEMAVVTFTSDDLDNDGIADSCDMDVDGDNVNNNIDNCPTVANPNQEDLDRNGIGDICDNGELEIPKGFSPNGDGTNDEFIIAGLHKYPNNSIQIYNRYGNLVYESNNYQNYWDGVSSGKTRKLPAAPYFYVLSVNGGSKIVKGWLYINY